MFFFVLTDPAVAVAVTGSPWNTAGGLASAVSVIGGAFLHPMGKKTTDAEASTRQTDFKFLEHM
jgi:hypothetical protein